MLLALDLIGRTLEGRPNLPSSPVPCPAPIVHLVDLFFQGWHLGPFLTRTAMRIDSQICGFTKKTSLDYISPFNLKKKLIYGRQMVYQNICNSCLLLSTFKKKAIGRTRKTSKEVSRGLHPGRLHLTQKMTPTLPLHQIAKMTVTVKMRRKRQKTESLTQRRSEMRRKK